MTILKDHFNETERLTALNRYAILDTPKEPRFDHITETIAAVCDTTIAMISLLDRDRLWVKSVFGLEMQQTKRAPTFCNKAIQGKETLVIPNTQLDLEFFDCPFVKQAPGVGFYAGALLTTSDGYNLGTLCVMDHHPRQLHGYQLAALEKFARLVVLELENDFHHLQMQSTETALRQTSRLASIGELTVGIAHEINNPLAAIQTRMGLLRKMAENGLSPDAVIQCATKVEAVVDRIHSIVKGLRTFARGGNEDPVQGVTISTVMQDAVFFFEERLRGAGIDFKIENLEQYANFRVRGRTVQICQAILNLLLNARDAVEGTGWIQVRFQTVGERIQIRVSDSGPRVTPAVMAKLFQPFFTTKDAEKGTGLGLSVSRSLIESFGGSLFLDQTEVDKAFVIELSKV